MRSSVDENAAVLIGIALAAAVAGASAAYRSPPGGGLTDVTAPASVQRDTAAASKAGQTPAHSAQRSTRPKVSGSLGEAGRGAAAASARPEVNGPAAQAGQGAAAASARPEVNGPAAQAGRDAAAASTRPEINGPNAQSHAQPPTPAPPIRLPREGRIEPPPPYFQLDRPFADPLVRTGSKFYPYGTTAGGRYMLHHGIDIPNSTGTPVRAIAAGEVVFAGPDTDRLVGPTPEFYGNVVIVRHAESVSGSRLYSLYGHLSAVNVSVGQPVLSGDVVGAVGATGVALGPHLHLEIRTSPFSYGSTLNPELFLSPDPGHGAIVGAVLDRRGLLIPNADVALYSVGQDGSPRWSAATVTYPDGQVNPDANWRDNFVFADTALGSYEVLVDLPGQPVSKRVAVTDGSVIRVELRAGP